MRRKAVSQRLSSVAEVRATLAAHRDRIGAKLEARQPPSSSGEVPSGGSRGDNTVLFSYRAHFDHMDAELVAVEHGLITAEDEHVRELVRIAQLRRLSDELFSELYQKQVALRRVLTGLYGTDHGFDLAATAGRTPANPRLLVEQVDQTVQLLRNPAGPAPARKIGGVTVDFAVMADELETVRVKLRDVRMDLDRARKTADRTRTLTNRLLAEHDNVVPWVVGSVTTAPSLCPAKIAGTSAPTFSSLEGLFRLVGERELAVRIRDPMRRITRRQGEDRDEEAAGASEVGVRAEPADGNRPAPDRLGDSDATGIRRAVPAVPARAPPDSRAHDPRTEPRRKPPTVVSRNFSISGSQYAVYWRRQEAYRPAADDG